MISISIQFQRTLLGVRSRKGKYRTLRLEIPRSELPQKYRMRRKWGWDEREYQINRPQQKSALMQFYDVTVALKHPENDLTYDFFLFVSGPLIRNDTSL